MTHKKRTFVPCALAVMFILLGALTVMAATTETVLYSFAGSGSGSNPYANLIADTSGNLYGTTGGGGSSANCNLGSGCGTIFELSLQSGVWTQTVLYSFQARPLAMALDRKPVSSSKAGALYGTTASGGATGHGTVFELAPPPKTGGAWTETVLDSFAGGTDGKQSREWPDLRYAHPSLRHDPNRRHIQFWNCV